MPGSYADMVRRVTMQHKQTHQAPMLTLHASNECIPFPSFIPSVLIQIILGYLHGVLVSFPCPIPFSSSGELQIHDNRLFYYPKARYHDNRQSRQQHPLQPWIEILPPSGRKVKLAGMHGGWIRRILFEPKERFMPRTWWDSEWEHRDQSGSLWGLSKRSGEVEVWRDNQLFAMIGRWSDFVVSGGEIYTLETRMGSVSFWLVLIRAHDRKEFFLPKKCSSSGGLSGHAWTVINHHFVCAIQGEIILYNLLSKSIFTLPFEDDYANAVMLNHDSKDCCYIATGRTCYQLFIWI